MAERKGLEPALRAQRGNAPFVPHENLGEPFPGPLRVRIFIFNFLLRKNGGETGIRTLETLLEPTRFPGVRLRPLGHLST
jgi:hypothetical protein